MKRTIPLTRQSAWFMRLAGFLVIVAGASGSYPAHFFAYYEYDFNISVYRICMPAEIAAADGNGDSSKYICLESMFNSVSICLVGQGKWAWKPDDDGHSFRLPLPESAGIRVQMLQFSRGEGKIRQNYNFKVVVRDAGEDTGNDCQGNVLLQKERIYPGSSVDVWYFTPPGKTLFFIVVETSRQEIIQAFPEFRFIIKTIPPYPHLALKKRIEGNVTFEAVTDIYGKMVTIKKVVGHPLLKKAAVAAVRKWVIEPYILCGIPRRFYFKVIFHFKLLPNEPAAEKK